MIEIRNLTKKYRELTVIDNFCHSFDGGKVYGIMGENGAGKSTLFRCIAGIESYDGSVVVNENKQIGYMNDTPFYYSYVTGMEHIEFCLRAKGKTISRDEIEQLNEKFALPLQRYASRYSLGMKKRLMLLTLMLQDNDIVIMDEPFNGIDLAGTIILVCQQHLSSNISWKNSYHRMHQVRFDYKTIINIGTNIAKSQQQFVFLPAVLNVFRHYVYDRPDY